MTKFGLARIVIQFGLTLALLFAIFVFSPVIFPAADRDVGRTLLLGLTFMILIPVALFIRWLRLRRNPELLLPDIPWELVIVVGAAFAFLAVLVWNAGANGTSMH